SCAPSSTAPTSRTRSASTPAPDTRSSTTRVPTPTAPTRPPTHGRGRWHSCTDTSADAPTAAAEVTTDPRTDRSRSRSGSTTRRNPIPDAPGGTERPGTLRIAGDTAVPRLGAKSARLEPRVIPFRVGEPKYVEIRVSLVTTA